MIIIQNPKTVERNQRLKTMVALFEIQIDHVATVDNAEIYLSHKNPYDFCLELLNTTEDFKWSDMWVRQLEQRFQDLLDPIDDEDSCVPNDG